ncbi:nucleotide exchange factor GrpE [Catellatospora sp. KI3]|uniref:nucleotide exchange factor GrpE n=1 Tax=Catellatospora sp. KI3 TaxID=3041620 RepID=UPI0024821EFC|nr:nucleotide exchange factor GrpE [Catellatospora sp. KI3]MDI1461751.1 nucleotide exchange factor GrpE [Catellatospora sp. KI3]
MSEQPETPAAPAAADPVQEAPAQATTPEQPEAAAVPGDGPEAAETVDAQAAEPAAAEEAEEVAAAEPVEGELVEPAEPAAEPVGGLGAELAQVRTALEERTADLQRVTAEYANYRKRVERDRTVSAELATGQVLASLLPILDDLDRARDHGDLSGPFGAVADQLNTAVAKFGLVAFGEKGDAFDPNRHEAVAHLTSADVTEPTCIDVMRRGYLLGERLLRPAMVAVAAPE